MHSPIQFKLSLHYLQYLIQCKSYRVVKICWFLDFFYYDGFKLTYLNIFDPWLAELVDVKPTDMKGQLFY